MNINIKCDTSKKLLTNGKICKEDIIVTAEREFVTGTFINTPMEQDAIRMVGLTLEDIIHTAINLGGGGDSIGKIEKGTDIFLSRKYNWTIEPADALEGGSPVSDYADYYKVKADFTVTCNGIKTPHIYLDRSTTKLDQYGEFRPPIIATIYGCTNYTNCVGVYAADATEYTYAGCHDHWGYVQLGGANIGDGYTELDPTVIPHDESTVVISRGNLCRNAETFLTAGQYKLVMFEGDINQTEPYTALAESFPFTLQ